MRAASAALLAFATLASASPVTLEARHGPPAKPKGSATSMSGMSGMSGMGGMSGMSGMNGGMAAKKEAKNPVVTKIPALFSTPEHPTERVKIRYGPFTMASANDTTLMKMPGMEDEGGVVDVMWDIGEPVKPCETCVLKHANATLTYLDNSPANLDSGAWLHHITLATVGPGRKDYACPDVTKHGMGILGGDRERFMVVHNDRNESYYGIGGLDKAGYQLKASDKWNMVLELKNEMNVPKQVYLWQEFEYLPGNLPSGWLDVKPVWLDAQPCGAPSSEIHPPKVKDVFSVESNGWTAPEDAKLLTTVGHMHDGGSNLQLLVNGKAICDSVPTYGQNPAYTPTKEAIALGAIDMTHITRYSPCNGFGEIKKGDNITLRADYDFKKNAPGLGNTGAPVGIMGIALTMLGVVKK